MNVKTGKIQDDATIVVDGIKYTLPIRGTADDGYPSVLIDSTVFNGKGSFGRQSVKPLIGLTARFIVSETGYGYNFSVIKDQTEDQSTTG